jgi:hypothetical protein
LPSDLHIARSDHLRCNLCVDQRHLREPGAERVLWLRHRDGSHRFDARGYLSIEYIDRRHSWLICIGDGHDAVFRNVQRRGHLVSVHSDCDGGGPHPMIARRLIRDERGVAAVEFAITSPVYFLALFGLAQAGLWLWSDFSLQRAVDAAARCAAITPSTCANVASYAATKVVGLSVPSSAFTVATAACGAQVSAAYDVPTFTSGLGLPNITVHVKACYPI